MPKPVNYSTMSRNGEQQRIEYTVAQIPSLVHGVEVASSVVRVGEQDKGKAIHRSGRVRQN